MIQGLIEKKHISKYRLAKESGIPYSTLSDIISGKTRLEKCSAETVYRLAQKMDITMEELLRPYLEKRPDFELYKSNVCHRVKVLGDVDFIIETLEKDEIRTYYDQQWYRESFYLLAMLDYISRVNDIPVCEEYQDIRCQKLSETLYPKSVLAVDAVSQSDAAKEEALKAAIPEFLRFNIIESEVRNVV